MFVMETIHKWNSVCDTLAVKTDPRLFLILTLKLFWQYYNMIIINCSEHYFHLCQPNKFSLFDIFDWQI